MSRFLYAPLEALTDPRLTDPERRVLLVLFSFRDKTTNVVFPGIDAIAARAGYRDKTRISKITSALASKGWLKKKKAGFSRRNSYTLYVPEAAENHLAKLEADTNLDSEANNGEKQQNQLVPDSKLASQTNLDRDTNSNLDSETNCKEDSIEHNPSPPTRLDAAPNLDSETNNGRRGIPILNDVVTCEHSGEPKSTWRPPPDVIQHLAMHAGVPREFILDPIRLYEFELYWSTRSTPRDQWPAKFLTSCRSDWVRHQTEQARQQTNEVNHGKQSGNEVSRAIDAIDDTDWARGLGDSGSGGVG